MPMSYLQAIRLAAIGFVVGQALRAVMAVMAGPVIAGPRYRKFIHLENNVECEITLVEDPTRTTQNGWLGIIFQQRYVGGSWWLTPDGSISVTFHHSGDKDKEKTMVFQPMCGLEGRGWSNEPQQGWKCKTYIFAKF